MAKKQWKPRKLFGKLEWQYSDAMMCFVIRSTSGAKNVAGNRDVLASVVEFGPRLAIVSSPGFCRTVPKGVAVLKVEEALLARFKELADLCGYEVEE